jgi:hypothetical protein
VDDEFKKETPKDTPVLVSTLKTQVRPWLIAVVLFFSPLVLCFLRRLQVDFPDFTYRGAESLAPKQSIDSKMLDGSDPFANQAASAKPLRFEDVDNSPDEDAPIKH